jgi:hypothetical protein
VSQAVYWSNQSPYHCDWPVTASQTTLANFRVAMQPAQIVAVGEFQEPWIEFYRPVDANIAVRGYAFRVRASFELQLLCDPVHFVVTMQLTRT